MKKLVVRNVAPNPGAHTMRLDEIEEVQNHWRGEALRFHFVVVDGPEVGKEISRTTSRDAKLGGSLGKLLTELAGRELAPGDLIDLDTFIGEAFVVDVALGSTIDGGGDFARIKSVRPALNPTVTTQGAK